MGRRLIFLVAALAVLVAASFVFLRVAPPPSPTSLMEPPERTGPVPAAAQEDPAGYSSVEVKVTIPPLSAFPPGWAKSEGCAHTRLSGVLGAALSQGSGVVVFAVEPGKPAAEAGITPADRLGEPGACPNTLVASFAPGEKARTISWTIRRPKTAALREAAAREAKRAEFPARVSEAKGKAEAGPNATRRR
jgi:hypothetical protein